MSELKPCPFCGGEAEFVEYNTIGNDSLFYVACSNDWCGRHVQTGICCTREYAAELWNTRHVETCTIERNECGCNFAYRLYTLSCGHTVWTMGYIPDYCVRCGRKVEE